MTMFKTLHDPYSEIRNLMKNGTYIKHILLLQTMNKETIRIE